MYAFVHGQLEQAGPPTVVSAAGIGWEIWIPERLRRRLPPVGEMVRLHTHLHVREDEMTLYGFGRPLDREIFRALLSVSGVGPKVALAVLGDDDTENVLRGIRRGDPKPLLRIKGVGRKLAERMVLELEDKAVAWVDLGAEVGTSDVEPTPRGASEGPAAEAVLALQALGVSPDRATAAVAALLEEHTGAPLGVEDLLRAALRRLHPSRQALG